MSTAVLATIFYKSQIIDLLKKEIDKNIESKLEVDKIELNLLKGFPNISIEFKGVSFYSSFKNEVLLKSENIYFVLNVMDLIGNDITIEKIEIANARLYAHTDKEGRRNYDVFVTSNSKESASGNLNLKSVVFKNVEVKIFDEFKGIEDKLEIEYLLGSISADANKVGFAINSDLTIVETNMNYFAVLEGKQIRLDMKSLIENDVLQFLPSTITIQKANFNINGSIGLNKLKNIDLEISSSKLQFADLISLMPHSLRIKAEPLRGKGEISIKTNILGKFGGSNWPGLESDFSFHNFELHHNQISSPIKNINIAGNIKLKNIRQLKGGLLKISEFNTSINEQTLTGKGTIKNFRAPEFNGTVKGVLDVGWAMSLLGKNDSEAKGAIGVDVEAGFKLDETLAVIGVSQLSGKLEFNNISMANLAGLPLAKLNGLIDFEGEKANLENLSAIYGSSDVKLNGIVQLPRYKKNKKRAYINLDVESDLVNLDELLGVIIAPNDSVNNDNQMSFYSVLLTLKLKHLQFLNYKGTDLNADLSFDEHVFNINSMSSKGMGGDLALQGSVTNQFNGDYYIKAKVKTKHIDLDSLLYVFENFKQDFITGDEIKGDLDSEVYTTMYFGPDGTFKRDLLFAEASLLVRNGELNNFEPIMSLSSYLNEKDENLAKLRFSDITSQIVITNDTVYIANMNVGTNVRNIKIGGYHTLDQHINYRLAVPVINTKTDSDNNFGNVRKDNSGELYFPFKIKGTTSDYRVTYDLKTASSNFVKGIGNAIIGKKSESIKSDTLTLDDEEFFDWDDNL